uniref:Uncharacterized protein n=1 Tax=Acrobeloides nanus TaxID=290746 RepID=A0A914DNI6_9BILA
MLGKIVLSCICLSVMVCAEKGSLNDTILLYSAPFYSQLNMSQKRQFTDIVLSEIVSDYDAQLSQCEPGSR